MKADPSFRMTIEDVFSFRDRGIIVTGRIESGTLKVGDKVNLMGKTATVAGIHSPAGEHAEILLFNVAREDICRGGILTG